MSKLRFGMVGAGVMAGYMARALAETEEVEAYAVAARDFGRARALAEKYGLPVAYGSYDELFADNSVDVVYISTPNSHHFAHARAALEHGKHVVCEKAFTLNEAQAQELFALARSRGLFIMEAMWTRFLPFVPKLRELMASGVIGEAGSMTVEFGVYKPSMERLHLAALGGGALLDVGLYAITFAMLFFGNDIASVRSSASLTSEGVDGSHAIILQYKNGRQAVLHCSIERELRNQAVIYGTEGRIVLDRFWQSERISVYRRGEAEPQIHEIPFAINGYDFEIRAAAADIAAGRLENATMPHAETLRMLRFFDKLRREWGVAYPPETEGGQN